ncbi:MAG: acyloxyacyl hydrolase [Bacteroidales bacterium]
MTGAVCHAYNLESKRPINYSINFHFGSGLPHHPSQVYFNNEYIKSLELNAWFYDLNGKGSKNSIPGAGYFFSNLGNSGFYGNFHSLYLSLLNPPISSVVPVQFKLGFGIAYATKKFDIETNPFNRAIGSHLNAYGQISLTGRIAAGDEKLLIRPGVSFHHISSGSVVAPNQGINMVTFHAGFEFKSGHSHSGTIALERDITAGIKNRFSIILAPGTKQVDWRNDKQILTSSLIFDYGYIFRPQKSIGMGISLFYNDSWAYVPYTRTTRDESLSPFQSAFHISMQLNKGPLAFILHPGVYIYNTARDFPYLTHRLGIKYSLANNLTFQVSIKSHWFAVADYFEWGIGYEFTR